MNAFKKKPAPASSNPAELLQRSRELTRGSVAEQTLPIEQIVPNPEQPRKYFAEDGIRDLAASIREHGVLEPVMVRPIGHERYEIVFGERRYRAAREAGLTHLPVIIRQLTERERDFISATENLQRHNLSAFEEVEAKIRLIGLTFEIPETEVVQRLKAYRAHPQEHAEEIEQLEALFKNLGREQWVSFVTNKLRILNLPQPLLKSVREGQLDYSKAVLLARAPVEEQAALLEQVLSEGWSQQELQQAIRQLKNASAPRPALQLDQLRKRLTPKALDRLPAAERQKVMSHLQELQRLLNIDIQD